MPRKHVRRIKRKSKKLAVKDKRSKYPRIKGEKVRITSSGFEIPLDDGRTLQVSIGSNLLFEYAKKLLRSEISFDLDPDRDRVYRIQAERAMGCVRCNNPQSYDR